MRLAGAVHSYAVLGLLVHWVPGTPAVGQCPCRPVAAPNRLPGAGDQEAGRPQPSLLGPSGCPRVGLSHAFPKHMGFEEKGLKEKSRKIGLRLEEIR